MSKDEAVIQYALTKIIHLEVTKENWGSYQNILLQWAVIEPSTLHYIIDVLLIYRKNKYPLNKEGLQNTFITIIKENSSIGHIGEVSWAIWACILFEINISSVATLLSNIENPVIALLTLDAKNKNLIDDNCDFSLWKTLMIKEEVKSENWLLAYEAYINNWLPSVSGVDYIKNSDGFKFFQENDVHFYNCNLSSIYEPDIQAFKIEEMSQYTTRYR